MDEHTLLIILTVFVIVAAIALVMQLGTLFAMFLIARNVQARVTKVWPEIEAIIGATRRTAEKAEGQINKIGAASVAILDITKHQVEKLDDLLNDANSRARVQMERAEMVLDDTMGRAQETVSIIQRTVLRPVREMHGVLTGLRASLAYLSRGGRPTVDHATSDEEMFI